MCLGSPRKNTGVGCHFLLQGIFSAQGSNPCLLCLLHQQVDSLPLASPVKPTVAKSTRKCSLNFGERFEKDWCYFFRCW